MIGRPLILSLVVALGLALAPGIARAQSGQPFQQDPLGPIANVTKQWQRYQPADAFCVKPDVNHYTPGGTGATATGRDPACRRSGFARREVGLVKVQIATPTLCPGCRRLFIDFSQIPVGGEPPQAYAHGHAYYRLASPNPTYTVDPIAHSPNTKNFTNDKLIAPDGSPQEQIAGAFDLHAMEYVTDTANFVHNQAQGPYYVGPWYMNRQGERIQGVYLDVNVADATRLPISSLNAISYQAGFNSGQACPSDDDLLYGGCVDWGGSSAGTVDPYAR